MPIIVAPSTRVLRYISKRGLKRKYEKQISLLGENLHHPSLNVERLNPKERGIYSFRIDRQFRGFFVFLSPGNVIKVIDANDHYQ